VLRHIHQQEAGQLHHIQLRAIVEQVPLAAVFHLAVAQDLHRVSHQDHQVAVAAHIVQVHQDLLHLRAGVEGNK
jgi:hypothetical protein